MMEIVPLAFDSMGTRSMATFVRTGDTSLVIDPGAHWPCEIRPPAT